MFVSIFGRQFSITRCPQVLFTNPDVTIDIAFRRAMSLVECEELNSLTIANIAIYRYVVVMT